MKTLKNQKGITLIALVVTIIVLIILAVVSISLILGQDGIVKRATEGRDKYSNAAAYENEQLANVDAYAANIGESTTPSTPSTPTTYTAYVIGQEVTVGGESFYVLEDSDSTQSTVTLLAKYNLNTAGEAQAPNANYGDTAVAFSSNNYWASAHAAYTDWSTKKLDINTVSGEVSGDAIYKAKAYATAKGGTNGRLLTYEEADTLKTSYSDMIWGKANTQSDGNYLYYWLSSARQDNVNYVWFVDGYDEAFDRNDFDNGGFYEVRPVITVSKSLVQ